MTRLVLAVMALLLLADCARRPPPQPSGACARFPPGPIAVTSCP
jgi:hypothetical protein